MGGAGSLSSVSQCLPRKYEDLSSILRIYIKKNVSVMAHTYNPAPRRQS